MVSDGKRSAHLSESSPRILLYGHDTFGLGHYRRNLSIATELGHRLPQASVLCLTGSPCSDAFPRPPRFDCVRLPSATKDRHGNYTSLSLELTIEELTRLRRDLIETSVRRFQPDLVLVDHSPIGMGGELLGALEYLKTESPSTPVILGLRDIIDDEKSVIETFRRDDIYSMVEKYYDSVFVYGTQSVYDPGVRYQFSESVRRKMQFMGYLYRNGVVTPEDKTRLAPETGRLVVVTVGGGADGENVIRAFLRALASSTGRGRFDSVIVTGPLMAEETRADLEASALQDSLPVRFVTFSSSVLDLFSAADVVVSMGGYNTLCEVLALGKKSVVIPRTSPRREQLIRARRFQELGLVDCLDPRELGPGSLLAAVDKALIESEWTQEAKVGANGSGAVGLDFGGLSRVSRELTKVLGERLGASCGHRSSL